MWFLKVISSRTLFVPTIHKRPIYQMLYIVFSRIYNFADDTAILYTEKDPRRFKEVKLIST